MCQHSVETAYLVMKLCFYSIFFLSIKILFVFLFFYLRRSSNIIFYVRRCDFESDFKFRNNYDEIWWKGTERFYNIEKYIKSDHEPNTTRHIRVLAKHEKFLTADSPRLSKRTKTIRVINGRFATFMILSKYYNTNQYFFLLYYWNWFISIIWCLKV